MFTPPLLYQGRNVQIYRDNGLLKIFFFST